MVLFENLLIDDKTKEQQRCNYHSSKRVDTSYGAYPVFFLNFVHHEFFALVFTF